MTRLDEIKKSLANIDAPDHSHLLGDLAWMVAIVDKYPKTADGVVITDKMPCYFPIANGTLCFYAYLSPQSEPTETYPWDKGYSTLELAEASRDD